MLSYSMFKLEEFYKEAAAFTGRDIDTLLPPGINKEIGHFNIFDISETIKQVKRKNIMPYNRRAYYKISLIRGKNRAEYADKVIDIEKNALLFATPKVPYHWFPLEENQAGSFCVFTDEFLIKNLKYYFFFQKIFLFGYDLKFLLLNTYILILEYILH